MLTRISALIACMAALLCGQSVSGPSTPGQLSGTTDPATCSEGYPTFYNTSTHQMKVCTAANTWTVLGAANITGLADPGGNGIVKRTGVGTSAVASSADIIGLWTTCSGFLKSDGTCAAAGTGTVTSVAMTAPSWLTVGGSPVTTNGTLAVTATSGQTANQFIATPNGVTGAVGLRAIVGADVPAINLAAAGNGGVTGTLAAGNGGTGNAFFAVSGPATSTKTFTFPNASSTVLTTNAAVTASQGGTGQSTYTTGDTLYSSATNTLAKLAGNTTSTKKFLTQTGTGTVSAAPGWNTIAAADVPDLSATYSIKTAGGDLSGTLPSPTVTATHLSAALPVNQGGTGTTSTLTGLMRGSASAMTAAELSGDATTSGSNTVTVARVNGVTYPSLPSAHTVPVVTASNTATYKALPACTDSGGNHLNYDTAADAFSCGTSSSGGGGSGAVTWTKYTVTMSAGNWTVNGTTAGAQAASTSQQITLFTAAAKTVFHGVIIKHSTAFSGTSITDAWVSLGTTGTPTALTANPTTFDVFQATGSTTFYQIGGVQMLDFNSVNVQLQLNSSGANLSAITAGSVDIWVATSTLP